MSVPSLGTLIEELEILTHKIDTMSEFADNASNVEVQHLQELIERKELLEEQLKEHPDLGQFQKERFAPAIPAHLNLDNKNDNNSLSSDNNRNVHSEPRGVEEWCVCLKDGYCIGLRILDSFMQARALHIKTGRLFAADGIVARYEAWKKILSTPDDLRLKWIPADSPSVECVELSSDQPLLAWCLPFFPHQNASYVQKMLDAHLILMLAKNKE